MLGTLSFLTNGEMKGNNNMYNEQHRIKNYKLSIQKGTACQHTALFLGFWAFNFSRSMFTHIAFLFVFVLVFPLYAGVSIANIFGSNGIIQCGKSAPVWGLADPGEEVQLKLTGINGSDCNQVHTTTADRLGKWIVKLDPLAAGDKFHMLVNGKNSKYTSSNMQAGDIWFYIGHYRFRYQRLIPEVTAEKWKDENQDLFPLLRIYGTAAKNSIEQRQENGSWKGPEVYNIFQFNPGIATHMGIELCRDKNIPFGIVHVASIYGHWIDEYLPAKEILHNPVLKKTEDAQRLAYRVGDSEEGKQLNSQRISYMDTYLTESIRRNAEGKIVTHPDYPQPPEWAETNTSLLYNGAIHPMLPLAIKGVIVNDPDGQKPFDASSHPVKLELLVKCFREWFDNPSIPVVIIQPKAHGHQNTVRFNARYAAQQNLVQVDTNVALAVMHDIEEFTKADELFLKTIPAKGRRAYIMANRLVYGNSSATNSTPQVTGFSCEGTNMILRFTQSLQTFDGRAPDGFALTAKGQKVYRPANAKIDGNCIILSAPDIDEPEHATYCYLNKAIEETPNVVGKNGLPLAAFSTELLNQKGAK